MQASTSVSDLQNGIEPILTKHAAERMVTRRLSPAAVAAAIAYGRIVQIRGADILAIGRKEVECGEREGLDLSR